MEFLETGMPYVTHTYLVSGAGLLLAILITGFLLYKEWRKAAIGFVVFSFIAAIALAFAADAYITAGKEASIRNFKTNMEQKYDFGRMDNPLFATEDDNPDKLTNALYVSERGEQTIDLTVDNKMFRFKITQADKTSEPFLTESDNDSFNPDILLRSPKILNDPVPAEPTPASTNN